jgi:hypothetical protein
MCKICQSTIPIRAKHCYKCKRCVLRSVLSPSFPSLPGFFLMHYSYICAITSTCVQSLLHLCNHFYMCAITPTFVQLLLHMCNHFYICAIARHVCNYFDMCATTSTCMQLLLHVCNYSYICAINPTYLQLLLCQYFLVFERKSTRKNVGTFNVINFDVIARAMSCWINHATCRP